jgi:trehalose 6-phosphate phosphatase
LSGCAVFLDIDGTLIDLAATPDAVFVPPHLHVLLRHLTQRTHGALALISGRSLADIDRLIGPGIAVAAEHGALLRDAAGQVIEKMPESSELAALRAPLQALVAAHPGTLFEQKQYGLSVHWRAAPQAAAELAAGATALAGGHPALELQPAHAALEIRQRGPGKAQALDRFMRMPPFVGQRPIFIGDDLTDEPAIARAKALGGLGLHVGRDFGGTPSAVLTWLEAAAAIDQGVAHG